MNLQLVSLNDMRLEDDIFENLGRLPKSLTTAYEHTFQTMREETTEREWDLATKALMWLMCSQELLTDRLWTEMAYWPKSVPPNGAQILFELCRNLVAWDRQSRLVKFAHLSVNEYLDTVFGLIHTNTMAAQQCLSLFEQSVTTPGAQFLTYASRHWPDHMELCYSRDQEINEDLLNQLQRFLGTSSTTGHGYIRWYQHASASSNDGFTYFPDITSLKLTPPNPLFVIACFPFGLMLHALWESDFNINIYNDKGETLLWVASWNENELAVQRLLDKGADLNAGSSADYRNPLMLAIENENEGIALRLLHCGLVRDTCDAMLQIVAREGAIDLLQAFLCGNPSTGITHILLVVVTGNFMWAEQLIEMLVAGGCRISITSQVITAAVSEIEYEDFVVRVLLSVDEYVRFTASAVLMIIETLEIDVIKMLIARLPGMEITDPILRAAASNSKCGELLIPMLLSMAPDIPISADVLMAAAMNDREVLELLLAKNSNIEVTGAILGAGAAVQWWGRKMLGMVLARHPTTLATVAVPLSREIDMQYHLNIIAMLLIGYPNLKITEVTVIAAVRSTVFPLQVLRLLLVTDPDILLTEQIVIETAKNTQSGSELLACLLTRYPDFMITEQIVIEVVKNWAYGLEMIGFLLTRNRNVEITERVLMAAAKNSTCGRGILFLLRTRGAITQMQEAAAVKAVYRRRW